MAVVLIPPIQADKLRMAYNNDIVRFKSDSAILPALANVTGFTGALSCQLYPAPDNTFFINLKPYIAALINTRDFNDTLQTSINGGNPNSFIYSFMDGTILQSVIRFSITLTDGTVQFVEQSLTWLAAVQQIGSYIPMYKTDTYILLPFKKNTADRYYLKYWQGYPFDIPIYSPGGTMTLKNETNLLSQTFTTPVPAFRLILSDGDDDETLENILPIANGYNRISITGRHCEFMIQKVAYKCGVYVKWLNTMGGYSYWLFENTIAIDRASKQIDELDYDNANTEDSFSRSKFIGKDSQDTIKVLAELLNEDEFRVIETIIDSPKIYMFTGEPYSRNGSKDWIEVTLKTNTIRIKNFKEKLNNMTLDFDLPQRYTQTL